MKPHTQARRNITKRGIKIISPFPSHRSRKEPPYQQGPSGSTIHPFSLHVVSPPSRLLVQSQDFLPAEHPVDPVSLYSGYPVVSAAAVQGANAIGLEVTWLLGGNLRGLCYDYDYCCCCRVVSEGIAVDYRTRVASAGLSHVGIWT